MGRQSWAVRLRELDHLFLRLGTEGMVRERYLYRHLSGHLGGRWYTICGRRARSTAPASPFARFPTSSEESELRATLRTHSRTFGTAGLSALMRSQRPHCGDDTRRTSRLGSTRGGRLRRRREKGCHPGATPTKNQEIRSNRVLFMKIECSTELHGGLGGQPWPSPIRTRSGS